MNIQRTRGRIVGYVALASLVVALGLSPAPAAAAAKKFDVFVNLQEEMKSFKSELAALKGYVDKSSPTLRQTGEHKGERAVSPTELKYRPGEHKGERPTPQTEIKLSKHAPAGGASKAQPAPQEGKIPQDDAKMIEWHVAKMQASLAKMQKEASQLEADFRSVQDKKGMLACRKYMEQLNGIGGALN